METKTIVNRVTNTKRTKICTTPAEVDEFINSLGNNDFAVVELKQEVPNESAPVNSNDIFSIANRLEGHDNAIPVKETRTLMGWFNFTSTAFKKAGFKIGEEVTGYTLTEEYVPITKLDTKWGLDVKGNVTQEPVINPRTQQVLLYDVKGEDVQMPLFRKVAAKKGEYVATTKPTYVDTMDDFSGTKKVSGKKTPEYQEFLNQLHKEFTGDFSSISTAEPLEAVKN